MVAQIGRLEEKLADKEELIDLYVEASFKMGEEVTKLKMQAQLLTKTNQDSLAKIQDMEVVHSQQLATLRE